eukprot:CAMPEP_0197826466 /NCGR_PEP_ID=MMETSP1437-20131217/3425_1 /TAXON_ID=49252 ORGANISM="Eucampia antarctica, Strain CCMP1452" /NCGR_SAMPLE_ID=MMETSP1437 /ASSEMBLY_ACC=CAM_ASM_001096 /LENGTH=333 /DNA_ID=CAMNT_0043426925 /DNA_START=225 /DNA_END=1223 /DNA_ORIENTATION=-
MSDHMLMVEWKKGSNWDAPRIVPYQDLKISPAASALHYGMECFEGMKAYKSLSADKSLRLFRPDCNMERLAGSMDRLDMPGTDFDANELIKCIKELVKLDRDWIPYGDGYSLYIRPTVISTHPYLGITPPDSILLYIITCPVGPYFKTGLKPVRLTTETPYVRAWPGGTGNSKIGGNYGPTMRAGDDAVKQGYQQVLWLFGKEKYITEVGAMNVFFFLKNAETGKNELVTPPLSRGDILPGVTRRSILDLAKTWEDCDISERDISMIEVRDAAREGRLIESFGAGTAAIVTPISCIKFEGEDIEIPAAGDLTKKVLNELTGIQYGKIPGPHNW